MYCLLWYGLFLFWLWTWILHFSCLFVSDGVVLWLFRLFGCWVCFIRSDFDFVLVLWLRMFAVGLLVVVSYDLLCGYGLLNCCLLFCLCVLLLLAVVHFGVVCLTFGVDCWLWFVYIVWFVVGLLVGGVVVLVTCVVCCFACLCFFVLL